MCDGKTKQHTCLEISFFPFVVLQTVFYGGGDLQGGKSETNTDISEHYLTNSETRSQPILVAA